jgi:phospholipase/carboxylesterase
MRHTSTPEEEEFVGLKFLYRPGASRGSPLLVLVHGRAGAREVIWPFERSAPEGVAVVSFQAFLPDPLGGFSWWDIASREDRTEAIASAGKRVAFAIERIVELYDSEPSRLCVVGFSQGSALLSFAVLSGNLRVDGLGILAGFVARPRTPTALLGSPAVLIAHGSEDEVVDVEKARAGARFLEGLGLAVTYVEDQVGHKVGIQGTRALKTWFASVLGIAAGG